MGDYKVGRLRYQREYKRRWRKNPKNRAKERRWRLAHPEDSKAHTQRERKRRTSERKAHFAGRDCCDICGKKKKLVIDHDRGFARNHCSHHPTRHCRKCRRGALCHRCNTALSLVEKYRTSVLLYLDLWRRQ